MEFWDLSEVFDAIEALDISDDLAEEQIERDRIKREQETKHR